ICRFFSNLSLARPNMFRFVHSATPVTVAHGILKGLSIEGVAEDPTWVCGCGVFGCCSSFWLLVLRFEWLLVSQSLYSEPSHPEPGWLASVVGLVLSFALWAALTLKRMGLWLCGVCFTTHTTRSKCRHGSIVVPPPDNGEGNVWFVLYDLSKPHVPSCSQLDHVDDLLPVQHDGFTLALLDSLFVKGLRTVKSIPPKCRLGFSRALRGSLDKVICKPDDISSWVSLLVLPLCLLKTFCPRSNLECKSANKRQREEESITNAIRSWGVPGGSLQLVMDTLAESAPPMVDLVEEDLDLSEWNLKQCRRKICDGYYTAAVRVLSSSGVAPYDDATLHELKAKHPFKIKSFPRGTSYGRDGLRAQHLIDCLSGAAIAISDELVSSITQVVNLFLEGKCPMMLGEYIASASLTPLVKIGGGIRPISVGTVWRRLVSKVSANMIGHSLDGYFDGLQFGVGYQEGNSATLALPDCTTEITPCGHAKRAWYLDDVTIVGDTLVVGKVLELIMEDGGPVSVDPDFGNTLVIKRVSKAIGLLDAVAQINDPQCDVLNYAFIASCLEYATLQPKLLRHEGIVAYGSTFDDALCVFNNVVEIDFLSNPSEVVAFRLMKKMADIYFTRVTKDVESYFSLSPWQMALWQSQREEHTLDWLRVVPISGLGHTMNGKTYRCVLCYRLGVPLFSVSKPCSTCSKVFTGDVYGDHAVSCAGVIGIKHRHNAVRDTLVDICFRSGISVGKEVDIGLGGGCDKALRPADMLLYSWEGGLDVCVDLTGSSPLTQTGMTDFVPGRAVIDVAQPKRDAVTLQKRVRKFSMAQDIRARAAVHIFYRISFSIAKGSSGQWSRYAEKDQINIDTHENLLPIDYYIDCDGDHPATIYEDFMENLFGLVESKRRYGFIRLRMHRREILSFSLLIRSFNAYINGVHDGLRLFEIGEKPARYFLCCEFTSYGEQYYELIGFSGRENLVGIKIGRDALIRYAEEVQSHLGVSDFWKRSIVGFALTFSEALRFKLIKLDAIDAFRGDGRIEYDTAGRDLPRTLDYFRIANNYNKLKHNSIYAKAMVVLRTIISTSPEKTEETEEAEAEEVDAEEMWAQAGMLLVDLKEDMELAGKVTPVGKRCVGWGPSKGLCPLTPALILAISS
ncbi:putative reverse transcriptase domain-containing protein, partial [Tanacetum coccineum]